MNLYIIIVSIGVLSMTFGGLIKVFRKKRKVVATYVPPLPVIASEDMAHPNVIVKSEDRILYDKFMAEYDPTGGFKFDNVEYRPKARLTCPFGISNGFKMIGGKMVWGYVRLHTGVDRAGAETKGGVNDVVYVPFNFNRSAFIDYKGTGYGTLIQLFNDEYGFEVRIAHMNPDTDILGWSLNRLKNKQYMQGGWLLGKAGTYGDSSGAHTHTEVLSKDDSCEVFDILLEEQYGDAALKEASPSQILSDYRKQEKFKDATDATILKDWQAEKEFRGCFFYNKYKYKFKRPDGVVYTRYASNLLFAGL